MKGTYAYVKTAVYFFVYLLLIQIFLPYLTPGQFIYDQRLNYDLVKNRPTNMEAVLEQVKLTIDREELREYAVLLGDSVAYSNPGQASESIASRLNEMWAAEGAGYPVFNLAMPAMQTGDVYTMLLAMHRHGISSDRLILDVTYAGFIERDPEPPAVYWLAEQLKYLDSAAYEKIEPILPDYARISPVKITDFSAINRRFGTLLFENVNFLKYKDLWQSYFIRHYRQLRNQPEAPPTPTQPWFTKGFLPELLQQPEYQRDFNDAPFVMADSNPQCYFLDKILELQQGKSTIIFLSGVNPALMEENINKPGYQENLAKIDEYFEDKDVIYLNTYYLIDDEMFSDHMHLTSDGYCFLARILLAQMEQWP